MTVSEEVRTPDLAGVLGPILQRVLPEHRPLFLAMAERRAADRYRGWANAAADSRVRAQLLGCAQREEDIANRVEALYPKTPDAPDATSIQRDLLAKNPDLEHINHSVFADRPLAEQFAIQAQGERLGAATWRSFARNESDTKAREVFLECAKLEEESALVLESILAAAT